MTHVTMRRDDLRVTIIAYRPHTCCINSRHVATYHS